MANKLFWATGLTGGLNNLDGIDGNDLTVGDGAIAIYNTGSDIIRFYRLQASSSAESSPNVICPDANAGTKRWHLITL